MLVLLVKLQRFKVRKMQFRSAQGFTGHPGKLSDLWSPLSRKLLIMVPSTHSAASLGSGITIPQLAAHIAPARGSCSIVMPRFYSS